MPDPTNQIQTRVVPVGEDTTVESTAHAQNPTSLGDLKARVSEDLISASDAVKDGANVALDKVQETISEHTTFAARQAGAIASALKKVGEEMESTDQPEIGRYASQIGKGVEAAARKMEGRNLSEIAGMAEDFGRKQPVAFLGLAALAGVAASRFLAASARRAPNRDVRGTDDNDNDKTTPAGLSQTAAGGKHNG
ncbi:hypothetical protein LPJGGPFB_04817 [Ensifer adhaerens]|nr:hypothetical protein [Ensifer adhaerens]